METDGNRRRASFVFIAAPLIAMSTTTGMAFDLIKGNWSHLAEHGLERSSNQYNNNLCGNYRIIRTGSKEVIILRRSSSDRETDAAADPTNGTFVGGNIKKVAVRAPFVAGYADALDGIDMPECKTGYFLLNTAKDELDEGLSLIKFQDELEQIGWQNPDLKEPL